MCCGADSKEAAPYLYGYRCRKTFVFSYVKKVVETLITEHGIKTFIFGSRSEFDDLCHLAVTELQKVYQDIVRINYNRKSEYVIKKDEKKNLEKSWKHLLKTDISLKDFDSQKFLTELETQEKHRMWNVIVK